MAVRVPVKPELLRWACERSKRDRTYLEKKFPKLPAWESGTAQPTLKQLEDFAKATYTPFGYLFLDAPPEETLPISDFRTLPPNQDAQPSANLLETIYTMQQRTYWLRETLIEQGAEPHRFVNSARPSDQPREVARQMRRLLGLEDSWAEQIKTWKEAVGKLRSSIEELGIMAVINGVVGNNTHRRLDVKEFRGFALSDEYAPLIFVNGADSESAKMFTLAHELAHLWLGREGEGVSGFEGVIASNGKEESFCDQVAAEFLVPGDELKAYWPEIQGEENPYRSIAHRFKVSPVVAARRALDLKFIDHERFFRFYEQYTSEENRRKTKKTGGGDFYVNQNARISTLFAREIIRAAREGQVSFRDAYRMTGLYGKTFDQYSQYLEY